MQGSATSTDAPQALPLAIVGAGLAAWTVVRELRKLDAQRRIVMLSSDSADFYAKPTLSNALAQERSADQLVTTPAAKMAETLQVQLLPHTQVLSLDTAARTLSYEDATGQARSLLYGDLVLATGADPIRLPMAGSAAAQVQSVNHLQDLARFHQVLGAAPKTVLVIGAGLIGCEFANDLLIGGYGVHVVDPSPRPLALLLPAASAFRCSLPCWLTARWTGKNCSASTLARTCSISSARTTVTNRALIASCGVAAKTTSIWWRSWGS